MSDATCEVMGYVATDLDVGSTLEAIDDPAFLFDAAGRLVFANRAALRTFGFSSFAEAQDTFAGRKTLIHVAVMHPRGTIPPGSLVQRALRGEAVTEDLERVVPLDGRPHVLLRIVIRPIIDPCGNIIGAIKLAHDVTFEEELARMKEEFVHVTSHELRTPATILRLAAAHLLAGDATPDEIRHRAERIDRASRRIESISRKLLDIASISAGNPIALEMTEARLDAVVAESVASIDECDAMRVRLRSVPVRARADVKRLGEVVQSLLDNALRYSPAPSPVEVAVVAHDGVGEVSVADHGIGIPTAKQPHIFEHFYRAHTGTPFDRGGLGASLYLAEHIMKAHGGRIWFESRESAGSIFRLALSVKRP